MFYDNNQLTRITEFLELSFNGDTADGYIKTDNGYKAYFGTKVIEFNLDLVAIDPKLKWAKATLSAPKPYQPSQNPRPKMRQLGKAEIADLPPYEGESWVDSSEGKRPYGYEDLYQIWGIYERLGWERFNRAMMTRNESEQIRWRTMRGLYLAYENMAATISREMTWRPSPIWDSAPIDPVDGLFHGRQMKQGWLNSIKRRGQAEVTFNGEVVATTQIMKGYKKAWDKHLLIDLSGEVIYQGEDATMILSIAGLLALRGHFAKHGIETTMPTFAKQGDNKGVGCLIVGKVKVWNIPITPTKFEFVINLPDYGAMDSSVDLYDASAIIRNLEQWLSE